MEELIKYFNEIEARLSALEATAKEEPAQEQKLNELSSRLHEMSALVAALSAKNLQLEAKIAALEARPTQVVEKVVEVVKEAAPAAVAPAPEVKAEKLNESEDIALDEETGLPELEVEFVDEPEPAPVAPAEAPVMEAPATPAPKEEPAPTLQDAAQAEAVSSVVPKIDNLSKAISLGDKFLFQRELFGGNGELMTKTIGQLNEMKSLDEAKAFIQKNFGHWDKESNAYELFTNLLKRRY
ncbi:MAG: hypothetical protein KBS77_01740 [Bacteroidales bacterium]|nr:hypothetical protein [Candidatus Colicola faecequi]